MNRLETAELCLQTKALLYKAWQLGFNLWDQCERQTWWHTAIIPAPTKARWEIRGFLKAQRLDGLVYVRKQKHVRPWLNNKKKRTNSQNLSSDLSICAVAHVQTCIHTHMHTYEQTHAFMIINMHTHVHIHAHIAKLLSISSFIRVWISNSKCCSRFPFYQKQAMYFCPNYVIIFF